jgi:NAD(P)-dependent dehydrogenase (short-subunit alcohol dehydrogenase family)
MQATPPRSVGVGGSQRHGDGPHEGRNDAAGRHERIRPRAPAAALDQLLAAILRDNPEEAADYRRHIPRNRFAEPEEIARAILFLASSEAAYSMGQGLILDGGLTLGIALALPDNG